MGKTPSKQTLRNKADALLMDYIRLKHKDELCWVCGDEPIACGHHFVSKKNSLALRYYLPNIIPIGVKCHFKVHNQPHLVEPVICFKLGQEWYQDLLETKLQSVKFTKEWAETNLKILQELMEKELNTE